MESSGHELDHLKVKELKEKCKLLSLKQSGKKADLIERLLQHYKNISSLATSTVRESHCIPAVTVEEDASTNIDAIELSHANADATHAGLQPSTSASDNICAQVENTDTDCQADHILVPLNESTQLADSCINLPEKDPPLRAHESVITSETLKSIIDREDTTTSRVTTTVDLALSNEQALKDRCSPDTKTNSTRPPRKRVKVVLAIKDVPQSPPTVDRFEVANIHGEEDINTLQLIDWTSQEQDSSRVRALAMTLSTLSFDKGVDLNFYSTVSRVFHDAVLQSHSFSLIAKWSGTRLGRTGIDLTIRDCRDYIRQRQASMHRNLGIWRGHWLRHLFTIYHQDSFQRLAACYDHSDAFQIMMSAASSLICKQVLDENMIQDVVRNQLQPIDLYTVTVLNSIFSRLTVKSTLQTSIILNLTGEQVGTDESSLRHDMGVLLKQCLGLETIELIDFTSHRDEDQSWTHGISPSITRHGEKYRIASRFVVSNAELLFPTKTCDKYHFPRYSLKSSLGVLGVTLPGPSEPGLRTGLALVTVSDGRTLFVLADNGRIVGNEDDGIDWKCRDLLSCDDRGHAIK